MRRLRIVFGCSKRGKRLSRIGPLHIEVDLISDPLKFGEDDMTNPLQAVLNELEMTEAQLKQHILSKAKPLFDNHLVANFVEKGYSFRYTSATVTGYNYMITTSNGMNILF